MLVLLLTLLSMTVVVGLALAGDDDETRAHEIAQRQLLIDSHVDVPYRLSLRMENVGEATEHGDFDFPRARRGGLDVVLSLIHI